MSPDCAGYPSLGKSPDRHRVVVVVEKSEIVCLIEFRGSNSKRSIDIGIDRELTHKATEGGEFQEFAGLVGIRIDRIVVSHDEVAIWSQRETHGSVQMTRIRENDLSCSLIGCGTGFGYREDLVVGFACNEQSVAVLIVGQARGTDHNRRRVRPMRIARPYLRDAIQANCTCRGKREVEARNRSPEYV